MNGEAIEIRSHCGRGIMGTKDEHGVPQEGDMLWLDGLQKHNIIAGVSSGLIALLASFLEFLIIGNVLLLFVTVLSYTTAYSSFLFAPLTSLALYRC